MRTIEFQTNDSTAWYVYIVRCRDGTYYTGCANDVCRRIDRHNRGLGAKYVRGRAPVRVVYSQAYGSRGDALRAEILIKKLTRKDKEQLIRTQKGVRV